MPAHPKCKTEEQPGYRTDSTRHQFLCIDDDGRECRRENEADHETQYPGPEQIRIREDQCEGRNAENREPNDPLASYAIAERAADQRT